MTIIKHITSENWKLFLDERRTNETKFSNILLKVNRESPEFFKITISYSQDWDNMEDFIEAFDHLFKD